MGILATRGRGAFGVIFQQRGIDVRFLAKTVLAATVVVACSVVTAAQGAESESGLVSITDQVSCEAPVSVVADKGAAVSNGDCESGCALDCVPAAACPRIVGQVNWVYLWRDKPDRTDIFYGANRDVLVNGADFDMGPTPGIDATLTYYRTCDTGFEVRYLWLDDQCPDVTFDVPAGTNFLNTTPNSRFLGAGTMPAEFCYSTKLQTVEINLRKKLTNFDLLLGFRYVDLRERLEAEYLSDDLVETETWGVDFNNLYGFQTGAEATLWQSANCKLRVDGFGKAGIYYNQMTTHFETRFFDEFDDPVTSSDDSSKVAFLGEVGFNAVYQVNCHLSLRAGYQLLWLSGVATAGRQVPATANFNGGGGRVIESHVDGNSSIFYHGLNTGLEVTW
jgi:hypothetical protein